MPAPPPVAAFFVLRTPLLPFDRLIEWSAALTASTVTDASTVTERIAADADRLRMSYRDLLADPIIRESIFVASPDLDRALDHWLADPNSNRGQAAERALTRYFTRMASRPTPFGLFGSTALGRIGDATSLTVAPASDARRHTRLDIDYLIRLAAALQQLPEIRRHLRYRPNTSLYPTAGEWRYIEHRLIDKVRSYHLVSVECGDALDGTLVRAREGATAAELAASLVAPGTSPDEADCFINELIDNQVLIADVSCQVTGDEPHGAMTARLQLIPDGPAIASPLAEVARALQAVDRSLGVNRDCYGDIARHLEALPAKVDISRLFQVDLVRPSGGTLGADVVQTIRRGIELLHALQNPAPDRDLDRLKRAWTERYEERAVPLSEALDSETGLGAVLSGGDRGSSPLLDDLDFPMPPRGSIGWGRRERHLLDLVGRTLQTGAHELQLCDADVRELTATNPLPLPHAYAAMVTVAGNGSRSPVVVMQDLIGPSGARLLGRFCHADSDLHAKVTEHLRAEEALDGEAVFAEIAHLPEGRVGNVILRPALRSYEIPFLGQSGLDDDHQIRVDDLTVQLVGQRFVLRSTRLGKRIVPRLSCAHDFSSPSVGIYRFLCLVQSDSVLERGAWDWGPLNALPFLPRLRVGDVVLSRSTWRLTMADITLFKQPDVSTRFAAAQAWRRSRHLPRWVVLSDYDNTLPVDLDNVLAVESFVHLLKGRDEATLTELYPAPGEMVARGPDGIYAHELVVPFVQPSDNTPAVVARAPRKPAAVTRHFLPGSEWVFAKLYGGSGLADRVIGEAVAPISRELMNAGGVERWFFIRYADPDEHVRWRVQVAKAGSVSLVRRRLEQAIRKMVEAGLVRRATFDTYDREIERYGGPEAMSIAEQWFWADSECTADVLHALREGGASGDDRWRAGALSVDRLLVDFGLDAPGKAAVLASMRESFRLEFHVDAAFRRSLAEKFRPVAPSLDQLLVQGPQKGASLAMVDAAFTVRRRRSRSALRRMATLAANRRLLGSVASLAPSYLHMTLNRLFRSEHRMHELVLYDFLTEIYRRRLARYR